MDIRDEPTKEQILKTWQPAITMMPPHEIDVAALEAELRSRLRGEVRFDAGSRALYSTDASNYRQIPIGVVIPKDKDDVVAAVQVCHQYGAPITSRGGGTSLAGQTCNVAVILDFSKYMNTIVSLDPEARTANVLPGIILDDVRNAAEQHHLTFGPDPATHDHCTLGGMIGNNSCGTHSVMAGRTADNIEALEILTYDGHRMWVGPTGEEELESIIAQGGRRGEIYAALKALRDQYAEQVRQRFPKIPRRVSGFGLDQLLPENGFNVARALVGSEGTCVTVLEAKLRLVESPPCRALLVVGYEDVYQAGYDVPQVLEFGPIACEGLDECLITDEQQMNLNVEDLGLLPRGSGWMLVEFGGRSVEEAKQKAHALQQALKDNPHVAETKLYDDRETQHKLWKIRESGLGATAWVPGHQITWPGWEDSSVPVDKVGDYLRDFRKMLEKYGYSGSLYGHFGDGCIHISIDFDMTTRPGIDKYLAFINEMADVVVRYGGSLSGEHGDGQARGQLLVKMFGPELIEAFREFKRAWDPDWKMNPGKVVDAYAPDENLRLGTAYNPSEPKTHFHFPNDHFSFGDAALRCAGVGECRRLDSGTMCPSFQVTREEQHSTRGRARLLFEMTRGDFLQDGWKSEEVKDALDLCLACKGCKGDCPVNVDMASYKAEFLSHYYAGRLRPITAYTMGLIMHWARLASAVPRVANFFTQTPMLAPLAKAAAGIDQRRRVPAFAEQTFMDWWRARPPRPQTGEKVIFWVDTFNNHFHPQIARAAVEVLETAGFDIQVPQGLCCGRPLYDYGFLEQAKGFLENILEALRPEIRRGVPVVGLEPSCMAVFRDELHNLFPHDEDAKRLREQSFIFSEFLTQRARHFELPKLDRKAIVHVHCHHKAIWKDQHEKALLDQLGLDYELPDDGCCGMAGSFGFEAGEHYDVSQAVGERVLLPTLRGADDDTLVITGGFSCHEQIVQATDKQPLHIAEVVHLALVEAGAIQPEETPRSGLTRTEKALVVGAGVLAAAGVLAGGLAIARKRRA